MLGCCSPDQLSCQVMVFAGVLEPPDLPAEGLLTLAAARRWLDVLHPASGIMQGAVVLERPAEQAGGW